MRVSGEGGWNADRASIHPPRRLVPRLRPSQGEGEVYNAMDATIAAPDQSPVKQTTLVVVPMSDSTAMQGAAERFDAAPNSDTHSDLRNTAWMGGPYVEGRYLLGMLTNTNLFRVSYGEYFASLRDFIADRVSTRANVLNLVTIFGGKDAPRGLCINFGPRFRCSIFAKHPANLGGAQMKTGTRQGLRDLDLPHGWTQGLQSLDGISDEVWESIHGGAHLHQHIRAFLVQTG